MLNLLKFAFIGFTNGRPILARFDNQLLAATIHVVVQAFAVRTDDDLA